MTILAPTVPTDIKDSRVMRAWYQSLRRQLDGIILSVKDFGAIGNGSVDDTLAVTKAISYASENHRSIYFPAGNYKVTDGFTITEGVNIFGDGPELSVIEPHFDAADTHVFNMTAGGNLNVFDLSFDGTDVTDYDPTNQVYMIDVDPSSGTLENVNIHNVKFSNLTQVTGVYETDPDADLRATHCIFLDNVDHVTVTDCTTDTVSGSFLYAQYVNHLFVQNNALTDVGWYPIHLEARVRFFTIDSNYFNMSDTGGVILGGFIDAYEDVTLSIPNSGTDSDKVFYHNGIISNNFMYGYCAHTSVIDVLSMNGVVVKNNILNGVVIGTNNSSPTVLYHIHVGTRAASDTTLYGPPINISVLGNMIRSGENGTPFDFGIRVDNDNQSASDVLSRRPIEHIIVKDNIIGFNLYDEGSTYSDINMDKGIYFDGGNGGMNDVTCEDNSILVLNTNQSSADGAGCIDFTSNSLNTLDGVKIGGNRLQMNGTTGSAKIVGIYIDQYVSNVVNTKPNHFKNFYTAVETVSSGSGGLYFLDNQVTEGDTDPYIFGTALTKAYHDTLGGDTASRPASGKNLTSYMTYFDTDLGHPMWYDGSNWVSALGSTSTVAEFVEDTAGAMVTGNTETGITVTYEDGDGTLDFVVADTTVAGDSGSTAMTPGDTLTVAGGTNITTAMSGDTLTVTNDYTDEVIEDLVGAMFSGNTETLITATYQDADGTIDLVVDEASIDHGSIAGLSDDDHTQYSLISSQAGAPSSTPSRVGEINIDTTGDLAYVSTDTASSADWDRITNLTTEEVQDIAGGMVTGNTETLITVTYQDGDGTIDFVVDNDLANYSNTNSAFFDTAGDGLSSSGSTVDVDLNELTTETTIASGDFIAMVDITDSGSGKITFANFEGTLDHDSLSGFVANEHIDWTNASDNFDTTGTGDFGGDVTLYEASNDANPEIRVGAADAEELHIQTVYDSGAQTLDYVLFQTDAASATADKGEYRFNVDGTLVATFDDGGLEIKASGSLSFGAVDILTDSAGTTTLNNIDAVDSTTGETIEDIAGALVATGGTKTGISVTYQDSTGDMDFVVADTTVAGDSGSTAMTPGDTLTIAGGTNATTAMSGDTLTVNVDDAFIKNDGDVGTGTFDFGGADDFEIPNGATPTVDTAGQIAIDTTITDHTGLITYHDGNETLYTIAIPTGNLTTTDGHIVSYNATNNEFEMVASAAASTQPNTQRSWFGI